MRLAFKWKSVPSIIQEFYATLVDEFCGPFTSTFTHSLKRFPQISDGRSVIEEEKKARISFPLLPSQINRFFPSLVSREVRTTHKYFTTGLNFSRFHCLLPISLIRIFMFSSFRFSGNSGATVPIFLLSDQQTSFLDRIEIISYFLCLNLIGASGNLARCDKFEIIFHSNSTHD